MSASPSEPRITKKTGEGYDKPNADQELPIDINYQKLPEWLVSRQKLPADWHKRLEAIKSKISEAEKELPAGLLSQLPGPPDAPVDYFRAVQVRDKLAESGERTLFGGLSGQAGTWDKIVKAYENGGVFLGEAAQTLIQNVDYEIPYLRKQMVKCNQQMADADRRHAEYSRSAVSCANNYKKECERLGISGSGAVGAQLRQLSSKLPRLFLDLVQQLRSSDQLDTAITYYQHFTAYAHGTDAGKPAAAAAAAVEQQQELPHVLHALAEVREGRTAPHALGGGGDAANNAAADPGDGGSIDWGSEVSEGPGAPAADVGGVDWGVSDAAASDHAAAGNAAGGISWDFGNVSAAAVGDEGAAAAGGGVDWDVALEEAPAAEAGEAAAAAAGPSLDWDIDMSEIGVGSAAESSAAAGIDWGIDLDAAAAGSAAAAGAGSAAAAVGTSGDAAADRLQRDSEYRSKLLDDLQELRAFLVVRRAGLSGSSSSTDLLRALAPEVVAATDAADVGRMLACVEGLLAALNDDKLRQLLMISSSSRYMERLQGSLQRKAGQEARMLAAAAETQARKQEGRATLVGLQPKLAEIVAQTRSVKQAVEAALAKQFAGRRVNVLGEINNALSAAS